MSPKCLVCGNGTSSFFQEQGYHFSECSTCGFFFVDPMPTDVELARVYSPEANYQSNKLKKDYKKEKNFKYLEIFERLKKYTVSNQKVLDVGASDGEFLYYARNNNFQVYGIEPNETTADIAKSHNLNVHHGFLGDSHFPRDSFDVLRLGDVLEHSNSPQGLINDCKSFLKKDGLLVISIPNMDSFWAKSTYYLYKIFGLPWSVLEPPHHLLYFSKDNLELFLKKNGFNSLENWYYRPPTLKYELGNTHLYGKFRREKGLKNLFVFLFGFSVYSALYFIDFIISPIKQKDYSMICIYQKNA